LSDHYKSKVDFVPKVWESSVTSLTVAIINHTNTTIDFKVNRIDFKVNKIGVFSVIIIPTARLVTE